MVDRPLAPSMAACCCSAAERAEAVPLRMGCRADQPQPPPVWKTDARCNRNKSVEIPFDPACEVRACRQPCVRWRSEVRGRRGRDEKSILGRVSVSERAWLRDA